MEKKDWPKRREEIRILRNCISILGRGESKKVKLLKVMNG